MGRIRAQAINESARGEIIAAFDPEPFEVKGMHRAKTEAEIIENPEIDALFVCTPNFRNKELTQAGLLAGKHIFCEKPPAMNAGEVRVIQDVEKQTGKCLQYGLNHRHHGSVIRAKEVIDSGKLGNILWMRGRYGKSVNKDFFNNWRANKELAGGGILLDQGIHMLDLFLYFGGAFHEVQSMVSNLFWELDGIEDNVFANLRNQETGVVASLHSTMTQWRHLFSFEIFLTKGHIVINGFKTSSNSYGDEVLTISRNRSSGPAVDWGPDESYTFHVDTSWRSEIGTFFDSIEKGQPVSQGSSEDAFKLLDLIDRIYNADR